jgi:K+/H+ antiporter YhaU regulatory subunit KhtT
VDRSLRDAEIRERYGVTVVGIVRGDGERIVQPSGDTMLRRGDRATVFGLAARIDAFVAAATERGG